ncbi:carboxymuconolactone decarboxylase family protein [Mycolicibacterium chlorophenolicum]|uniref:Carboxymuconolactone decarboxylase family protein n=1 Tax=Mycolicibacterium chlorophenolicum TaxID=37916 RepID=A0A0J6WK03_9MYCO|nr:carboxymuconolactone decarboxylase family protein [Mycolicibacterium chlorophenolicum]KMO83650.1 Carboxymuconolactone decarboxylase family protein [Mycolicibacterium chlorophenolicum]
MALVPLRASDEFSEADKDVLAVGEKAYGQVLNTWAAIGNSPGLFAAYLPFLRQVNGPGELEIRIKDLAAVRVGLLNHCRYTVSHRCASAENNGVTPKELADVARGDFSGFSERERAALDLANAMTQAIPASAYHSNPSGVPPALLDDAVALFSPRELVELTMNISVWNALSRFHRIMHFDLDMPPAPADVEARL